jgi:hypothetical protein
MTYDFPCGNYTITIPGVDDAARLSIDGGATWLSNLCLNTSNCGSAVLWETTSYKNGTYTATVFLNGPTDLVLEFFEAGGGAAVGFSYAAAQLNITVNGITGYSADVTIAGGDAASEYEYVLGVNGVVTNPDTETPISQIGNIFQLTGLTPLTAYNLWVRTGCGGGSSGWTLQTFTTLASCIAVPGMTVSNISAETVNVSWTPLPNASGYTVVWGPQGFVPGTGTPLGSEVVTLPPYQITGLSASTNYVVGVQADCGGSDIGAWAQTTFLTGCGAMALSTMPLSLEAANSAQVPWKEDFSYNDSYQSSHNWPTNNQSLPDCWTRINTSNGGYPYIHGTNQRLDFHGFTSGWNAAVMPQLPVEITPAQLRMQFWWNNNGHTGELKIYMTDNPSSTNLSDYELVGATTTNNATNTISFANYTGSASMYIAFVCDIGGGLVDNLRVWIDNTTPVTCAAPTAVTISGTTQTSATVSWTAPATAPLSYILEYKTVAAATYTTLADITATSQTLNGLNCGTSYNVRIKSDCGPDGSSSYTTLTTFTTLACPACNAPTALAHNTVTHNSANITWTAGGSETNWVIEWKATSASTWTSAATTAPAYVLTGLTAVTCYDVRVKAVCNPGDESIWSTVDNFCTPQIACDAPTNVVATNITDHTITVTWTPNGTEESWKIFYRVAGENAAQIGPITTPTYTLTDLIDSTEYEICVLSVCQSMQSDSTCIYATTSDEVGIPTITMANNLQLYPNPTTGELRIKNYELREGDKIEIYNMLGQKQQLTTNSYPLTTINVSHLSAGVYTVKIGEYVGKFVKK